MKKRILIASGVAFLQITGAGAVFAGGVDNLHNFSAEYVRTFNRNAATDSADTVVYNPAGTVLMDDGSYVNFSLQYLDKEYKNIVSGARNPANDATMSSTEPSIIPGLFGLYKKDEWSAYVAVTVPKGGGKAVFDQGSASILIANESLPPSASAGAFPITSPKVEAESVGIGITVGAAYKVCDTTSLSLGVRRISSEQSSNLSFATAGGAIPVIIDYENEATGWAGIFGVNFQPTNELNLAARYEMKTKLDYEYTINTSTNTTGNLLLAGQGVTNNMKKRRDLPALLGLGGSYQITPAIKVDLNLTYYLQEDADWAGSENNVDNGYDAGVAVEYTFNEKLSGSFGYMRTETGIDAQYTVKESPKLDANSFGTGVEYAFNDKFKMNAGVGIATYSDDAYLDSSGALGQVLTINYEKEVIFYSAGVQYKF